MVVPAVILRDAFESFAETLPAAERELRRKRFERFARLGFPGTHEEQWRYTDLSELAGQAFALPGRSPPGFEPPVLAGADALVYVNGHLEAALSPAAQWHGCAAPREEAGGNGIAALNAAFDRGGLQLRLAPGQSLGRPLHLVLASSAGAGMVHQRHSVELGDNAEASLVLQFLGRGGERLGTQHLELRLSPGARLRLYRLQDESAGGSLLSTIDAVLERDSLLQAVTVDGGGGLVRHDLNVSLAGPGAEVSLAGLYKPAAAAHLDNHVRIVHAAPHCRSRALFRGILDARSRAVFNGRVVVAQGAQKTDSEQRVANLLLSPRAEVNAKPELEIYADDVKCAHGATVGQLDAAALGYLRSRGIAAEAARRLLLRAFAGDVLERIHLPQLRAAQAALLGFPPEESEA